MLCKEQVGEAVLCGKDGITSWKYGWVEGVAEEDERKREGKWMTEERG